MTIIFYEVLEVVLADGGQDMSEIAAVDVTGMSEQERAATLADLKALYGTGCTYRKHSCNHDEHKDCTKEVL